MNMAKIDPVEFTVTINEWQLCPKCSGQGFVSKPSGLAGDVLTWSSSTTAAHVCDLCNGKKIISKVNGLPPE